MDSALFSRVLREVTRLPVISSHSHLPQETDRLKNIPDALDFLLHAYPAGDLASAGMSEDDLETVADRERPLIDRWRLVEPYWPYVRNTGFVQSVLIGLKELVGISDLNAKTLEPITEAVMKHSKPGYYHTILKERANIEKTVAQMDDLIEVDRSLFAPMPRLNRFCMVETSSQIQETESFYGVSINSLADLVTTIEEVCTEWKNREVAGVKLSHSYFRAMDFRRRTQEEASAVFEDIRSGETVDLLSDRGKILGDYLAFECCRAASELDLTIEFHLGLRSGTYKSLEGASVAPMVELLGAYPNARFDLSHSGYPYVHETGVLAKGWPNVFLNMSWIQTVSPEGSKRALKEWLRMVPYNKIIAFGDDVNHVEVAYGALVVARHNVATVLAELLEDGMLSESQVTDIATAMFHDTPARLYGL